MSFYGMDFDLEEVTPLHHSRAMVSDNPYPKIGNGMAVTVSGMTLTVAAGYGIFMGKYIYNDAPYTITVPNSFSGVLAFKFDLTQTNTATGTGSSRVVTNNQLSLVLQPVATFPIVWNSLGDINNGDSIGYCPIGKVTSTTTAVTYSSYFNAAGSYISTFINSSVTYSGVRIITCRINDTLFTQVVSNGSVTGSSATESITIPVGFQPIAQPYATTWYPIIIQTLPGSGTVVYGGNIIYSARNSIRLWITLTTSQLLTNITLPTSDPFIIY
jgi:hypothetical protein